MSEVNMANLAKLREPFPASQIGKLPKGGTTLDFVGHGFLTARFLDADPEWNWRPMAYDERGLPLFDENGGLWMYLTVGGVERIGYGDAGGRTGANAIKEAIGDALRNGGMRFGAALELWCKGDPDAPAPPSRTRLAQDALLALCKHYDLVPGEVGQRFLDEYGKSVGQAGAELIEAFTKVIAEEQAETAAEKDLSVEEAVN
jgi:hypothetical protein